MSEKEKLAQFSIIASEIADEICSQIASVSESISVPRFSSDEAASGSNSLDQSFVDSLKNKEHLAEAYLDSYYAEIDS